MYLVLIIEMKSEIFKKLKNSKECYRIGKSI